MVKDTVNYTNGNEGDRIRDAYEFLANSEMYPEVDEYLAKREELGEDPSRERVRELRDLRSRLFSE